LRLLSLNVTHCDTNDRWSRPARYYRVAERTLEPVLD